MITSKIISTLREEASLRIFADSLEYLKLNKHRLSSNELVKKLPISDKLGKKIVILDGYGRNIYLDEVGKNIIDIEEYEKQIEKEFTPELKESCQRIKKFFRKDEEKITNINLEVASVIFFSYFDALEEILLDSRKI